MRRLMLSSIATAVLVAGVAPAAAQARPTFAVCDNATSPDYPTLSQAPRSCNLGFAMSVYQAQPVSNKPFTDLRLRQLRWQRWGRYTATGRGLACSGDGFCYHVAIVVSHARSIAPAGGAVIYQLMVVRHEWSRAEPWNESAFWFQPGSDY
jgi:hypothetical protein